MPTQSPVESQYDTLFVYKVYQNQKDSIMRVNISLPDDLVRTVDRAAKQSFQSRSAYIRSALITRLRYEGEPAVPNAISDQDFQRAKTARALKAINQTLDKIK